MSDVDDHHTSKPAVPRDELSELAHELVARVTADAVDLREIHDLLDSETTGNAEIRQITGRMFTRTVDTLAIMRGFEHALERLERSHGVTADGLTADGLTAPAAVDAAMRGWLHDVELADQLIDADISAIRALVTHIGNELVDAGVSAPPALRLVDDLARNAIGRLDRSFPPTDRDERDVTATVQPDRRHHA